MLVCKICGGVFEKEETRRTSHRSGEPFVEEYYLCPCCNSDELEEATKCKICGEYFYDEYGTEVCEDCIDSEHTVETALKYGAERMESVAVNGAFFAIYSEEEINAILTKHFEEHFTDHSREVVRYCEEDKGDFAEWLIERNGN